MNENIISVITTSIGGLVVKSIVAIDGPRVRFTVDASNLRAASAVLPFILLHPSIPSRFFNEPVSKRYVENVISFLFAPVDPQCASFFSERLQLRVPPHSIANILHRLYFTAA